MKLFTRPLKSGIVFLIFLLILNSGLFTTARAQCEIGTIEATATPCDELGNFNVIISFEYANVGIQGFTIQGNGATYGDFEYADLPVTIYSLPGDGTTFYEFVVRDIEFPDCHNFIDFGTVDCGMGNECNIWDLVVDDHPCVGEHFYCYVNFLYENVSDTGFALYINGDLYGNFSYEDLPLQEVGPLVGDGSTVYHFLVRDLVHETCAEDLNFGPINCGTGGDCNIWDVYADVLPCNESGGFHVALNFEFINTGESGFRVQGNGNNYGSFNYNDVPVTIGPLEGDGVTVYEFVVIDNEFGDCHDFTTIDPVNCNPGGGDCEIGPIDVTVLPCNEQNEFYVLLDFDYANTSDGFTVQGNGAFYGNFLYASLPVEIGPLQGDDVTIYEFGVHDAVHEACGNATSIDPVSCEGETALLNFTTQVVSCQDEMYLLKINFEAVNQGSEGFILEGNGEEYGSFTYDQLPVEIGPLPTDGSTPYYFVAKDQEHPLFGNWDKLVPFTCEILNLPENNLEEDIKVYPNPSSGSVTIEIPERDDVAIFIYNSRGSLLRIFSTRGTYQMDNLHSGIYYYTIRDTEGNTVTGKLIVSR